MDKEYIVTLYRKEDLEQFYNEMQLTNFPLVMKRPLSRNTHYMMTEEQAERLRQDPRVWGVEAVDSFHIKRQVVNNEPYTISGDFWKDAPVSSTINPNLRQWGHLHCAGDQVQRRKGNWGDGSNPVTEFVTDTIEVHNNGRHVDVVIVDDPVSFDSGEWESLLAPGQTRFVQYQWFNELNTAVSSIDDDGQTLPTGTITYLDNLNTPQYHGIHVTGTAAGQYYGWANEANIYNMAITDTWVSGQSMPPLLIFDYLRAFHLNKPINPDTGKRNPTITNHSYGGIHYMPQHGTDGEGNPIYQLWLQDIIAVNYRGVTYDANNPGPSGWSEPGVEADFGIRLFVDTYPAYSSSMSADVQDAIDDGIVVIGSAGNDNLLVAEVNDQDYNNSLVIFKNNENFVFYYNRGSWPNTPDSGSIIVGALSDTADFRRSTYSMFGPSVDVFAPGDQIISAYGNTGFDDPKYSVPGNYYYPIQGTSMASPQVCGVIACLATGKERFTQADALGYLNQFSIYGDMTFDTAGGGFTDNSSRMGSPNKYLRIENPRLVSGFIQSQKGNRITGQTFPRISIINASAPAPVPPPPTSYSLSINNSGSSSYQASGEDAVGTKSGGILNFISCDVGNLLDLSINASGHPFWIKTTRTTGTANAVTTDITNNGTVNSTINWDTTNITPGVYYFICQYHSSMSGAIFIQGDSNLPSQTYVQSMSTFLSNSFIGSLGKDRDGYYQNAVGKTFNLNVGDTFMVLLRDSYPSDAPFWIKTDTTAGSANAVAGVINNGSSTARTLITWDTTGFAAGTYYFVDGNNSSRNGTITLS